MNGLQPSHEIRKLTIVLPASVVDALRSQLRGDETITDCIKRLVVREALGVTSPQLDRSPVAVLSLSLAVCYCLTIVAE
jgi:hypothetical protein